MPAPPLQAPGGPGFGHDAPVGDQDPIGSQEAPGAPPSAAEWFAQKHHVFTNKSKVFSDLFRDVFKQAGVKPSRKDILNYEPNLEEIESHRAVGHGHEYSLLVSLILNDFLEAAGTASASAAIDKALDEIKQEIRKLPEVLDPKWWR